MPIDTCANVEPTTSWNWQHGAFSTRRRWQTSLELLLVLSQGLLPVGWVWAKTKGKGFESQLPKTSSNFFLYTERPRHFSCEPLLALTFAAASKAEPRYPAEEVISSFTPDPFTASGFFILRCGYFIAQSIFWQKNRTKIRLLRPAAAVEDIGEREIQSAACSSSFTRLCGSRTGKMKFNCCKKQYFEKRNCQQNRPIVITLKKNLKSKNSDEKNLSRFILCFFF